MFWIIENEDQVQQFKNKGYHRVFVEVIPTSQTNHPSINNVSLVYVKPLDKNGKGYIFCIDHNDAFKIEKTLIEQTLEGVSKIFVRDKKEFYHYFFHKEVHQVKSRSKQPPQLTPTHKFLYNTYPNEEVNKAIPLSKHYEFCSSIFDDSIRIASHNFKFMSKACSVFNLIEQNPIKIDNTVFTQYFDQPFKDQVYTRYNLNTTTMRPSNTFGGINFSALGKSSGERKAFIPHNDIFLDIDISAYHPTLLGKLVGYEFPEGDIHQSFAKMYGVDYDKAKELTFKQLYGGVFKKYEHLEFFKKVKEYTDNLWWDFKSIKGHIECPISKHRFYYGELEDMNPQKLLNYLLQNLETSNNIIILWKILKLLKNKNTKLLLYVYDSFLLDVDKNEVDTIEKILDVFKEHNLKIKTKRGINYDF